MIICYFGNYNREYSRNAVLMQGLREQGVTIHECHTRKGGLKKFVSLYVQHKKIKRSGYDAMIVGFSGYSVMWFAKLLTCKPIIFDAFTSLYLSDIIDRKKHSPRSIYARYLRLLEKISYKLADKILYDTQSHIDYVTQEYSLSKEKLVRIFVGSREDVFSPSSSNSHLQSSKYIIHWHGNVVPFAGADIIIEAARILQKEKNIQFQIVAPTSFAGKQLRKQAKELHNITWYDKVPYNILAELIQQADVCLGVFGSNEKSKRVIPNKIFESIACKKPVITGKCDVLFELFTDHDILTVAERNASELAESVQLLCNSDEMRNNIADHGYNVYCTYATTHVLGDQLKEIVSSLIS